MIFDTPGVASFATARSALAEAGRYLCPVLTLGRLPTILLSNLVGRKRALFAAAGLEKPQRLRAMLSEILTEIDAGRLVPVMDRIYPLSDLVEAHAHVEAGHTGGDPIRVAHCWAHARRKLKEVFDRDGSEIAAEGLRRIAEFYKVEADIRGLDSGERLAARQARTAPLVAAFGDWLQESRLRVSAKSRLGEKLSYIHNHWDGLQTFLQDGRVEIDSNSVENLIRPIAINRKTACLFPAAR